MNKFWNIIFLIAIITAGFIYRDTLRNVWSQTLANYFPCKTAISYSIGTFDTRFGISKADFLSVVKSAEDIWEKPVGKNLFEYKDTGNLKINLIYDIRQEATVNLKNLGTSVENTKSYYESRVSAFETRKNAYETEVSKINRTGKANKETYTRLNVEKNYLNQEASELNVLQNSLNNKVVELNTMVKSLNNLASSLNLDVKKYNTIGQNLGEEFDEGLYKTGPDGQEIYIYQFENKSKLVRVLAHEFGHALGLEHLEDPKAIMYRLNNGYNEKLTSNDIKAVKELCGI